MGEVVVQDGRKLLRLGDLKIFAPKTIGAAAVIAFMAVSPGRNETNIFPLVRAAPVLHPLRP